MPQIYFEPSGVAGEVDSGTSILDASRKLDYELRHDCGGFATCSTCRVQVCEGMENLTEINLDEENMLEEAQLVAPHRLSCQAKILGDVRVFVPSADKK